MGRSMARRPVRGKRKNEYTIQRKTHVVSFLTEPNDLVTDEIGREALSMISETSGSVVG